MKALHGQSLHQYGQQCPVKLCNVLPSSAAFPAESAHEGNRLRFAEAGRNSAENVLFGYFLGRQKVTARPA